MVPLASRLILSSFLDSIELLVLLKLVESLALLFNHITVREWEVVEPLDGLHFYLIRLSLILLILQNLVGLDKSIRLVDLVFVLIVALIVHLLALILQKSLLILSLFDLFDEFTVLFLVNLINDLAQKIIVVAPIKSDALGEPTAHPSVDESLQERVGKRLSSTLVDGCRFGNLTGLLG